MTDTFTDGQKIRLFESGAIQKYLVERYDTDFKISYPPDTRQHHEMNCWVRLRLHAKATPLYRRAVADESGSYST